MTKSWMVRAERNGRLYDAFKESGAVAIGWHEIGSLDSLRTREAIAERIKATWPEWKAQAVAMATGQIHRFRNEIQVGDPIVTYDPSRRVYLIGEVTGEYRRDETFDSNDMNVRAVRWEGEVSRDLLGVESKNTLGSISTLFLLPDAVIADLRRALRSKAPPLAIASAPAGATAAAEEEDVFRNIQSKALEFTKDRVSALDWEEMQELVAGLLRAMGYKTQISPAGPDRGKDIVASPDGFGFQAPKIIVEVKHRQGAIGAPAVRSFIAGHRHAQDRGLYVSTGGFTKEAYYEAERSNVPLALMTIDGLVEALIEHYDRLDIETKQLLPLKRIYWPT
ncbi:restriction system protein [Rhizobium sp. SG_E_25_P2]|uniref:restriction endonuclease n=1 Tax=Rhizobium sp. SG_E_25_P2 TaxID=2879942 RepID=UPI002472FC4F|nr:restriction endonuclease [Rhizobium sp. SG_E_25_P2]MDH6268487.1 restriction system protein [Rhizobium sp. SG_E_25_P2]